MVDQAAFIVLVTKFHRESMCWMVHPKLARVVFSDVEWAGVRILGMIVGGIELSVLNILMIGNCKSSSMFLSW